MENNVELLLTYFPNLTQEQIERFNRLGVLYPEWNDKINVISRKDMDALYERHILHSLGIAKAITFIPGTRILDVGTGGGFPGIPLAILFPDVQFHLVDSIGKKIQVVKAIAEDLDLKNVFASHGRAESVNEKFDFVVSRAVTQMPRFVQWVRRSFLKQSRNPLPNGILYLKGGDLKDELASFPQALIFDLDDFFRGEFFSTKKVVYLPASAISGR